jgi:hypothetical protein
MSDSMGPRLAVTPCKIEGSGDGAATTNFWRERLFGRIDNSDSNERAAKPCRFYFGSERADFIAELKLVKEVGSQRPYAVPGLNRSL